MNEAYNYWLTGREQRVIDETMSQFDFSPSEQAQAKALILAEARKGGRFYAYNVTCCICGELHWHAQHRTHVQMWLNWLDEEKCY